METPNSSDKNTAPKSPKLLNQVLDKLRVKRYALRTGQIYMDWIGPPIFTASNTQSIGGRRMSRLF